MASGSGRPLGGPVCLAHPLQPSSGSGAPAPAVRSRGSRGEPREPRTTRTRAAGPREGPPHRLGEGCRAASGKARVDSWSRLREGSRWDAGLCRGLRRPVSGVSPDPPPAPSFSLARVVGKLRSGGLGRQEGFFFGPHPCHIGHGEVSEKTEWESHFSALNMRNEPDS